MLIGSLSTFTNLGLSTSLSRFLIEQGKTKQSNYDIAVTIIIQITLIIPLSILVFIFNDYVLEKIFCIPVHLNSDAYYLLVFMILSNILNLIGQSFNAILDSLLLVYIKNILTPISSSLNWVLILIVLFLGFGLKDIGFAWFLSTLIWFCLLAITAFKKWGKFSLRGIRSKFFYTAKKQISYGIKIYAQGLIAFFFEPLIKIIIANFFGIREVGYFDIAMKIKNQLSNMLHSLLYPIYPLLASIKDESKTRFLVREFEQKIFILIVPIVSMIIIILPSLIYLWLGSDNYTLNVYALLILVSFLLCYIPIVPLHYYFVAKGLAEKIVYYRLIIVISNLIIFFTFYPFLNKYSIGVSYAISFITSFIYFLHLQKKYLNILIFTSFYNSLKLFLLLISNIGIGILLSYSIKLKLIILIIIPIAIFICTIIMYRFFKFFTIDDLERYFGKRLIIATIIRKMVIAN